MFDQLQRVERQHRGAVTLGFGHPVDDAFGVEQLQMLERQKARKVLPASLSAIWSTSAKTASSTSPRLPSLSTIRSRS
jgi:hypothetical protein